MPNNSWGRFGRWKYLWVLLSKLIVMKFLDQPPTHFLLAKRRNCKCCQVSESFSYVSHHTWKWKGRWPSFCHVLNEIFNVSFLQLLGRKMFNVSVRHSCDFLFKCKPWHNNACGTLESREEILVLSNYCLFWMKFLEKIRKKVEIAKFLKLSPKLQKGVIF